MRGEKKDCHLLLFPKASTSIMSSSPVKPEMKHILGTSVARFWAVWTWTRPKASQSVPSSMSEVAWTIYRKSRIERYEDMRNKYDVVGHCANPRKSGALGGFHQLAATCP